jgi:hypothetical protein
MVSTANEHAFSHGMRDTRETLEVWSERPWRVLGGWVALSLAVAVALLTATWVVAGLLTPDLTPIHLAGLTYPSEPDDLLPILWRNSLVLALHGTACVAGFIAGASMPIAAAQRTGLSRWVHVKAGELAILFVCAVTLFSLSTQALYLGLQGSTLAYQLHVLPPVWWMVLAGAGLYMGYTPFNAMLFDRMIAATGKVGTAGFLIYVADSFGYIGSISLLLVKSFAKLNIEWGQFLAGGAYVACGLGLVGLFFAHRFLRTL